MDFKAYAVQISIYQLFKYQYVSINKTELNSLGYNLVPKNQETLHFGIVSTRKLMFVGLIPNSSTKAFYGETSFRVPSLPQAPASEQKLFQRKTNNFEMHHHLSLMKGNCPDHKDLTLKRSHGEGTT